MKKTVCVIFGREGYETEVLWKSAAGHLKDALKRTGLERIFDAPGLFGGDAAPVAVPEDAGMVLAVRSDAVPSDAAALLSAEAPRRFMDEDGLAAFLLDARRFAALAESGGSAETVMRVPEGRASFERGFAANASARERFELTGRLNREKLSALLVGGVRLLSADGVLVCPDAELGEGCEILPGTVIKGGVKVGKDCLLGPNTLLEDCTVGDGCVINASQVYSSRIGCGVRIGPFSHIRPNCAIGDGVKIGDFVELKNSSLGGKTSVAHLTYVGDSDVGARVNFGCGCVTVNYDGKRKSRTVIGDGAFIGCNSNLVAPVEVEEGSYIAAGSTITDTVPQDALAIARARQTVKPGWAKKRREE